MDELKILTQAMKIEQEGRKFYLQAAEGSDDPEAFEMFRTLAADEENHYNYIERQYTQRKAGKNWAPIPELDTVDAIDAQSPIFPKGKVAPQALSRNSTMEEVLLFGLGAEVKSFELYDRSAKLIDDPQARSMFGHLAAAERGHFDTLMMRYESYFGYPR